MENNNWKYYNHAMLPNSAPHEEVDISFIESGEIWKHERKPLLARYTTEFDCDFETDWWYVIKDTAFDINAVKAKRRYEINKGIKNFEVRRINPLMYKEELYNVANEAYKVYPQKYRPNIDKESYISGIYNYGEDDIVYAAFNVDDKTLCGYSHVKVFGRCMYLSVQKTIPFYEKNGVNAALVYYILKDLEEYIISGSYICDGERNVSHETRFQDYLEKYFCFRKAYCRLNVDYNPKIKMIINVMFPFRNILKRFDFIGIVHAFNSVMKMEEIKRSSERITLNKLV